MTEKKTVFRNPIFNMAVITVCVFSALFVRVSMINGYKYAKAENDPDRLLYLYMCVQTMLGVGMYNIQTTITLWIQVGLVLWLCTKLAVKCKICQRLKNLFAHWQNVGRIYAIESALQTLLKKRRLGEHGIPGGSLA